MAQKKKKANPNAIFELNEQYGKLPPQAVDLEKAVLGALMLEKGNDVVVMDLLTQDSFYNEINQKIFKAIFDLSIEQQPIDYHTVIDQLTKNGHLEDVGGPHHVVQLTSRIGSAAHIEYHSKIIAQKHIQRKLIEISSDIQQQAYDDSIDVNDLLEHAQQSVFEVASGSIKKDTRRMDDIVKEALELLEEASQREDGLSGVPSGFTSLDRVTSGWQRSDMIVLAARPSMGKTAFVLSMARNMAVMHDQAVVFFSLEMAAVQLVNRLISSETELGGEKIRNGQLADHEWLQLEDKIKKLSKARIFIDDTPGISLFELRSKCRKLKTLEDINIIIIDYLQLMTGPPETRGNREQEVSTISRGLKGIAKELNVPIIALSQLNRSVEMRSGDKRPQLSDLRESGAIEQDADIVAFVHRPEKMGIMEDAEGNSTQGVAEIIIAKHRNGAIEDVSLRFRAEFARFEEINGGDLAPLGDFSGGTVTMGSKMNDDYSSGDAPFESDSDFTGASEFDAPPF